MKKPKNLPDSFATYEYWEKEAKRWKTRASTLQTALTKEKERREELEDAFTLALAYLGAEEYPEAKFVIQKALKEKP